MKTIDLALQPIAGYLTLISRDTVNGWYEFEVGLPPKWVFSSNNDIKCEILVGNDEGKLVKISPLNQNIDIDDLVVFVETIINTNMKIVEKEKEFNDKMDEMKSLLEKEAKKFYQELDALKEDSFKNLSENNKTEKIKKIKPAILKPCSGITVTENYNFETVK